MSVVFYAPYSILDVFIRGTAHELVSRSNGPSFEIVDLPGKGKGLIALRDIKVFIKVTWHDKFNTEASLHEAR